VGLTALDGGVAVPLAGEQAQSEEAKVSDTLYRDYDDDRDGDGEEGHYRLTVPVEIDYEAATDALVDVISGGPSGATDDEVAARIVHAALGIGGDDDSPVS
jgi:hypothetical protein